MMDYGSWFIVEELNVQHYGYFHPPFHDEVGH